MVKQLLSTIEKLVTQNQENHKVDLHKIYELDFFTINGYPYLTAKTSGLAPQGRVIMDPTMTVVKNVTCWDGKNYAKIETQHGDEVMAVHNWDGDNKEEWHTKYSFSKHPINKKIVLIDHNLEKVGDIPLPDALGGHNLETIALNGKQYLRLQGFFHTGIIDLEDGVIIVQPNGHDNGHRKGEHSLVTIIRPEGDYLFGFTAPNERLIQKKLTQKQNKTTEESLAPYIADAITPKSRRRWQKGVFVAYDQEFNAQIISRTKLGLSRGSYIEAVESHTLGGKTHVMITESTILSTTIHIYSANLQKIKKIKGIRILNRYIATASAQGAQGDYLFYAPRGGVQLYNAFQTGKMKVLDETLQELCTVPQGERMLKKSLITLNQQDYVNSSPLYKSLMVSDLEGQIVLEAKKGSGNMENFLQGQFLESFDVVHFNGEDYLCVDEHRTFNLKIYNSEFQKVSELNMKGNFHSQVSLGGPSNQYDFSLIPLLKCYAYMEQQA